MLFFLEAEIFQDNKCFKYVYLRKKKKKRLGRMVSRTACLFGTAPTVNFHLFLGESLCPERWLRRDNEAQEVKEGSLGVVLELPNRLRGK